MPPTTIRQYSMKFKTVSRMNKSSPAPKAGPRKEYMPPRIVIRTISPDWVQ